MHFEKRIIFERIRAKVVQKNPINKQKQGFISLQHIFKEASLKDKTQQINASTTCLVSSKKSHLSYGRNGSK